MSLPAGIAVEVELTAGVWTDFSADVDGDAGIATRFGRGSEFSAPSSAPFQVTLDNSSSCSTGQGSYTPGRQVLYDGVTAHPYYPNLVPNKRIRLSYTISGTTYYRFVGSISSWQPTLGSDGQTPRVVIQATDDLNRLSRLTLPHLLECETAEDDLLGFWPMNEPAGYQSFQDLTGNLSPLKVSVDQTICAVTAGAGNPMPVSDGYTGAIATTFGAGIGPAYVSTVLPSQTYNGVTVEAEISLAGSTLTDSAFAMVGIIDPTRSGITAPRRVAIRLSGDGNDISLQFWISGNATLVTLPGGDDGQPHHYALTATNSAGTNWAGYVDGVLVSTITGATAPGTISTAQFQLYTVWTSTVGTVTWGPVVLYRSASGAGLSGSRITAHHGATVGFAGDTTGERIARYLAYAGVTDTDLDAGVAVMSGFQPVRGQVVLNLCQQCAETESGGAAFYVSPSGNARFADRTFRSDTTSALTVDAGADLDGATFLPAVDNLTLVNKGTANRPATAAGASTSVSYTDQVSVDANGPTSVQLTSYASTDLDALGVVQYAVASQSTPGYRLPQVAVDLMTATTAGLYPAIAAVEIGSRITGTSLDAAAAPRASMDFIVEGWAENITADSYTIVFDTSPADNPARAEWDEFKWEPADSTLNASITRTATGLAFAWATAPKWSTTGADYPIVIWIDEEQIQLNGAPGGSTSPQSWTGVTRGVGGTIAAAHSAGAVIRLAPDYRWQLGGV